MGCSSVEDSTKPLPPPSVVGNISKCICLFEPLFEPHLDLQFWVKMLAVVTSVADFFSNTENEWSTRALSQKKLAAYAYLHSRLVSSRRVHVCGRIDDREVPRVTIAAASDGDVFRLFLYNAIWPLRTAPIHAIPPAGISTESGKWFRNEHDGICTFSIYSWLMPLEEMKALVFSSPRCDEVLLPYIVIVFTSFFGAKPEWQNQCLTFHSCIAVAPAVHRLHTNCSNHVSAGWYCLCFRYGCSPRL